jgi:hypothetical protein
LIGGERRDHATSCVSFRRFGLRQTDIVAGREPSRQRNERDARQYGSQQNRFIRTLESAVRTTSTHRARAFAAQP